jgi:hypothetical protein
MKRQESGFSFCVRAFRKEDEEFLQLFVLFLSVGNVFLGVVCAGSMIATTIFKEGLQNEIRINGGVPMLCLVAMGIYAFSWVLSARFYKKREY